MTSVLFPEEWAEVRERFDYSIEKAVARGEMTKVIAIANSELPDDHPAKITRAKLERLQGAADPLMTKDISHFLDALRSYLPP